MKRRDFIKLSAGATAGFLSSNKLQFLHPRVIAAAPAAAGLSDPALQPKFVEIAPNALDPGFLFKDMNEKGKAAKKPNFKIEAKETTQQTGLINPSNGQKLNTSVWGYGKNTISWPGQTIQVMSTSAGGNAETVVRWDNKLGKKHLLPVDTNLHWCYSLPNYTQFSIQKDGVPIVTHLHGGKSDFQFDGNPEFFYNKNRNVNGPQWASVPGGFTNSFRYNNAVPAGNLWYHDHALGITRLNVYAGLAGFYFVRDEFDTGLPSNPLGLPAFPYELAYAIQDRMFTDTGALFYPAFPGDPAYADFITTPLPDPPFAGGGPTALAEFFGDHMVVNGKIWPKENVEPRNYRMRLLNGCDSRFMAIRFRVADSPTATDLIDAGAPIPFQVIGSDQGLASAATQTDMLVFEPGSRYDIVVNFATVPAGSRVIMENIGGDEPFGGDIPGPQIFGETDRIMAFDVTLPLDTAVPDPFNPAAITSYGGNPNAVTRTRKVALFEGMDEFGRLQPLLGTAEPATDYAGNPINWPNTQPYIDAGLVGQMQGSIAWHSPTTENPALGSTEIWEIYNATGDAHPVHLHLVNFEVLDRKTYTADVVQQPVVQHNGVLGIGFRLENISVGASVSPLMVISKTRPRTWSPLYRGK